MAKNTNLRALREKLGLSQTELVRRVRERSGGRFTQQSLSKLERNPDAESRYWLYIERVLADAAAEAGFDAGASLGVGETGRAYGPGLPTVAVVGHAEFDEAGECAELGEAAAAVLAWPMRDPDTYAVQVIGDGLRPRVKHGDHIVLEPARSPESGDEVLLRTTQGRYRFREYLYTRQGRLYFSSLNEGAPANPDSIPSEDLAWVHCLAGIVVASGGSE